MGSTSPILWTVAVCLGLLTVFFLIKKLARQPKSKPESSLTALVLKREIREARWVIPPLSPMEPGIGMEFGYEQPTTFRLKIWYHQNGKWRTEWIEVDESVYWRHPPNSYYCVEVSK